MNVKTVGASLAPIKNKQGTTMQRRCSCGRYMSNSTCPSYSWLDVYYDFEINSAIQNEPSLTQHDFSLGWSEQNERQVRYANHPGYVEYWYCLHCKRITEVGGDDLAVARVFKRVPPTQDLDVRGWKTIYILPDVETTYCDDHAPEKLLSNFMAERNYPYDLKLSPDETRAVAIRKTTGVARFEYVLEKDFRQRNNARNKRCKRPRFETSDE